MPEHLQKLLSRWLKKSKYGLERRKRIDPDMGIWTNKLRRFRRNLKKEKHHYTAYQYLKLSCLNRKVLCYNTTYYRRQIFESVPPTTHRKEYNNKRQEIVD